MSWYMCDFETTVEEVPRVWAWEALGDDGKCVGTEIDSFIEWAFSDSKVLYFHNMKFDSSYIMCWAFSHGWNHTWEKCDRCFTSIISDAGQYYMLRFWKDDAVITIYDSFKIISLPVADIGGAFGIPVSKGEIDYEKPRPPGYVPTIEEWDYLHRDCDIVYKGLKVIFAAGLDKMTQSANAYARYAEQIGYKKFKKWFPLLTREEDEYCRKAYYGGSSQVGKKFKGLSVGAGIVLDYNSMYPAKMRFELLPWGKPVCGKGRAQVTKEFPLYIQRLTCSLKVKGDHIPSVMGKHVSRFRDVKFIEETDGIIELTLTNVDIDLMMEQYEVYNITWLDYYSFRGSRQLFAGFVDNWAAEKEKASKEGNKGRRQIAKDMQNKLSGKFGTKRLMYKKEPYYDGKIKHRLVEEPDEARKGYVPVIAFITAYGRAGIIRDAQKNYDRFLYMDTDSLHLLGDEDPVGIDIDDVRLGAMKIEGRFYRARYLHPKCYIEEMDADEKEADRGGYPVRDGRMMKITIAGLPKNCREQVTWENFHVGAVYTGKLRPVQKSTGILLEETTFQIKED